MVYFSTKRSMEENLNESITTMANCLILLSHCGDGRFDMIDNHSPMMTRVFECKTCNRQFQSFQALGGHRASHKKPRLVMGLKPNGLNDHDDREEAKIKLTKPKVHECSICGLEFGIGQALGGHMRRHRGGAAVNENEPPLSSPPEGNIPVVKKSNSRRILCLDLNLTPLENDIEFQVDKKVASIVNYYL